MVLSMVPLLDYKRISASLISTFPMCGDLRLPFSSLKLFSVGLYKRVNLLTGSLIGDFRWKGLTRRWRRTDMVFSVALAIILIASSRFKITSMTLLLFFSRSGLASRGTRPFAIVLRPPSSNITVMARYSVLLGWDGSQIYLVGISATPLCRACPVLK